jgi:hypothetical protein
VAGGTGDGGSDLVAASLEKVDLVTAAGLAVVSSMVPFPNAVW